MGCGHPWVICFGQVVSPPCKSNVVFIIDLRRGWLRIRHANTDVTEPEYSSFERNVLLILYFGSQ